MMFTVGMKVVCVDDKNTPGREWKNGDKPTLGAEYIVLGKTTIDGEPCLFVTGFAHWAFRASRFRPLVSRKTDISFTAGADPESEKRDNRLPIKVS